MTNIKNFEDLKVWQKSIALADDIYDATLGFPKEEMFGIVSQMRRSAFSVSYNLSEGSSRFSPKDQAYFYQLSYSSLNELLCQVIICSDLGLIESDTLTDIRQKISEISLLINNLRKSRLK